MESKWIVLLGVFGMSISHITMWRRYHSAKLRIKELEDELKILRVNKSRDK